MPHSYKVITQHADFKEYVALKHLVQIQGYVTDIYLPVEGGYDPETRAGSVYNNKDHEYRYNDTPDFQARIAYLDPQTNMFDRGDVQEVNYTNTAYTLKNHIYCPGNVLQFSKLYIKYGNMDLSYFVREIAVLRNPNAKNADEEALIRLDLVIHV